MHYNPVACVRCIHFYFITILWIYSFFPLKFMIYWLIDCGWSIKNCQFIKIKMARKYLSYSQLQCVIKLSMNLNVFSNYSFILCWFVTLYWVLLFIYFLFLCGVDEKIKNGAVKMMFCLVIGLAASRKGIMWLSSINSEYKIWRLLASITLWYSCNYNHFVKSMIFFHKLLMLYYWLLY